MTGRSVVPDLIFDVGMSEGNDTAYYLAKGFRVVGVEADPVVYEQLVRRFAAELQSGRLSIIHRAASDVTGMKITFLHNSVQQGISGTSKHPHVADGYEEHTVETIRFRDILDEYGVPHYCKIDIEGHEKLFLKDLIGAEALPRYISVECHTLDPVAMLYAAGYRSFQLVDQVPPGGFVNPHPPREGAYVEKPDWHHASGPFGQELPGDWLDFGHFIAAHQKAEAERYRTWFDCHATA